MKKTEEIEDEFTAIAHGLTTELMTPHGGEPCKRLEFKYGSPPSREVSGGGMVRVAVDQRIAKFLRRHSRWMRQADELAAKVEDLYDQLGNVNTLDLDPFDREAIRLSLKARLRSARADIDLLVKWTHYEPGTPCI